MSRTEFSWFCAGFSLMAAVLCVVATCTVHGRTLASVQSALLALPPAWSDRDAPPETKRAQLEALAAAIEKAGRTRTERAFLVAWGFHESAYSLEVHAGRCPPGMCDVGRDGVPRARGPWQTWRLGLGDEQWARMVGVENAQHQADEAARRTRSALGMCKTVEGAFRSLTGRGCSAKLPGVERRMRTFAMVEARLR